MVEEEEKQEEEEEDKSKENLHPYLMPYTQNISKYVINLKTRSSHIELLEENMRKST